jgi:hypothetical protein
MIYKWYIPWPMELMFSPLDLVNDLPLISNGIAQQRFVVTQDLHSLLLLLVSPMTQTRK